MGEAVELVLGVLQTALGFLRQVPRALEIARVDHDLEDGVPVAGLTWKRIFIDHERPARLARPLEYEDGQARVVGTDLEAIEHGDVGSVRWGGRECERRAGEQREAGGEEGSSGEHGERWSRLRT